MNQKTMQPAVYIMTNQRNGTLYIGVTSNLIQRIYQHKHGMVDGFTKEHDLHILVWYQLHDTMENAIITEKRMKKWKREWKLNVIEQMNPYWRDLWEDINPTFAQA